MSIETEYDHVVVGTGSAGSAVARGEHRAVDGLRVADASIIPAIPNVHTHPPTMMIGEKAAGLLLTSGGSR